MQNHQICTESPKSYGSNVSGQTFSKSKGCSLVYQGFIQEENAVDEDFNSSIPINQSKKIHVSAFIISGLCDEKTSSSLHMNSTVSYVSGFLFVFQRNTEYEPDSHRRRTSTFCFRYLDNSIPLRKQGIRQIPKRNTRLFQAVVS